MGHKGSSRTWEPFDSLVPVDVDLDLDRWLLLDLPKIWLVIKIDNNYKFYPILESDIMINNGQLPLRVDFFVDVLVPEVWSTSLDWRRQQFSLFPTKSGWHTQTKLPSVLQHEAWSPQSSFPTAHSSISRIFFYRTSKFIAWHDNIIMRLISIFTVLIVLITHLTDAQ